MLPTIAILAICLLSLPGVPHACAVCFRTFSFSLDASAAAVPGPESSDTVDPKASTVQATSANAELQPGSRLAIVRYVSGEYARVVTALPRTKTGFKIDVGHPLDEGTLKHELANRGVAASPGDRVQITKVDFRSKEILLEINGGPRGHYRLRDHLQIGMGGPTTPIATTTTARPGESSTGLGALLVLDYGRPIPEMSPDDVKQQLAAFLDFSKEQSATVNWVETLPPEIRQAIADKKAAVGMSHDMVLAAMGHPDKKVRERDAQGEDTEDWIYGAPPAKVTFVTFIGDKVTRVKEFN
ncbi:MAG: hypothetical protein WB869_11775 [Candidatus Acidiferrales bacterium]